MDTLDDFLMTRPATSARPLLGLTVLLVEDSRFAAEGFRLLCLRSGARIRRADSLHHAHRHLRVYRPTVVIVDLGLPDGSGAELIADLHRASPRIPVILGTSGDPGAEDLALAAGADGFMAKPVARIAAFQAAILAHLPREQHPSGPHPLPEDRITPDPIAFRDDLSQVADALTGDALADDDDAGAIDYVTQFLGGVARSAGDGPLSDAVAALAATRARGRPVHSEIARLAAVVQARLSHAQPL